MTTRRIMLWLIAAMVPGLVAYAWAYGVGVFWNVAILTAACAAVEIAAIAGQRGKGWRDAMFALSDGSAVLTALIIAACLPPFVDVSILVIAALAAIGLAKHAYGGLGQNTFNPAMVGYAVVLVSYPDALAHWPISSAQPDTLSGATLLTQFRYREALTTAEFALRYSLETHLTDTVAAAYLGGGLLLIYKRLIAWRIPLALLTTVALCAVFGYDQGSSSSHGSIWFHWTSGGLIAAAFFVATDPVTHPTQARHQILFGALIGVLVYWIRASGSFPDGIAFAVLLANCVTPLLNRIYLHGQARVV